ncbi:ESPR-type extended signal peptide-containing protein [Stenotrophomonas maltophilia]|uniref:ESPR-type extended signal peptide-containing protein n=1 Tax=Stenotrophomonas maltophilia TaxID=40324 RepID=UPI001310DFC7
MNRIYRRIWNAIRQCWVVASELTSAKGKASRSLHAIALLAVLLPGVSMAEVVSGDTEDEEAVLPWDVQVLRMAYSSSPGTGVHSQPTPIPGSPVPVGQVSLTTDSQYKNSTVFGDHLVLLGSRSSLTGSKSVGYGNLITATGDHNTAIGYNVNTTGGYSTGVGAGAQALEVGASAFGNDARATRTNSIAIGSGSRATAANSVAIGANSAAVDSFTVSVGSSVQTRRIANVTDGRITATSTDAVTGRQLHATNSRIGALDGMLRSGQHSDSYALGAGSATASTKSISVGSASNKRRIQYLADGTVAAGSTDAVTGNQLHATHQVLDGVRKSAESAGATAASAQKLAQTASDRMNSASLALGQGAKAGGDFGVAVGAYAEAGELQSTALGYRSKATGINSTALGYLAQATASHTAAVGYGARALGRASLAFGYQSKAEHENSVALGGRAETTGTFQVSLGNATEKRKIVNMADGLVADGSHEAVTGSQLFRTNAAAEDAGKLAVAVHDRIDATTLALGRGAVAEHGSYGISTALGNNAKAYNGQSIAVGYDALSGVDADGKKVTGQNAGVSIGASTRSANGAVAAGFRASATGNFSIAVGGDAKAAAEHGTAMGYLSKASASQSTALGRGSEATAQFATASGNLAKATAVSAVALGDRAQATHENAVALGAGAVTASSNSVSVGSASRKRKIQYIADGVVASGSTDAITGNQLHATNQAVNTAQTTANSAKTNADSALAQAKALTGLVGQVSATGNVRLGGENTGTVLDVRNKGNASRKISGVADATLSASSSEAVTGRQLTATNVEVKGAKDAAAAAQSTAATAAIDAGAALAQSKVLSGLVSQTATTGAVRLGERNSGTLLDLRNSANTSRRVSGVADGAISADSTDAITGRQLHSTNNRVGALEERSLYLNIWSDSFSERAYAGKLGVAIGDSAQASPDHEGGVALGAFAKALGGNSVAVGRGASVDRGAASGFALGVGAQVEATEGIAIGANSVVAPSALGAIALGTSAEATEAGTASFGNASLKRRLVNVARGIGDHNATTVSQLRDSLATLGAGAGMDASGNVVAPTYTVQGETQNTVEDALTVLDGAVITAGLRADKVEGQLRSIFQDSPSTRADGMNQIALNGANGMVLTNLADGRVAPGSRDAVTGSQLYAAEQKISQNRNDLEAMRKEREMGEQAMRGLDASGPIDFGGARLTGVAEAKLSADSSDVVRGSQLYETNEKLQKLSSVSRFVAVGDLGPGQAAKAGPVGVAIGDSAEASLLSEGAVAIGSFATAAGKNSVALGRAAYVDAMAVNGFAIGVFSSVHEENGVAIGVGSAVKEGASSGVAIGAWSVADEAGTVAFGNSEMKRRLVNIANGTANHNAATVGQLRGALSALGGEVDANGNIVGPSFNVQGQSQSTLNGALEALDGAVVSTTSRVNQVESQLRSVFQETPSVRADGTQQLTLAGANGMVISNVANGLIAAGSRDAVNGGQLHSMQQQLNGRMDGLEQRIDDQPQARAMAAASTPSPSTEEIAPTPETSGSPQIASTGEGDKPTPQPKSKQDDTPKPQVDTADLEKMLARANEYTDGAISNFERRLDKMDKRFNRMAAMSSAQSAMAMNTAGLATYNRLGAGVGYSEGESAMAVGYQRVLNEKGSATFSLNGAFTNSGERSMGVGVGIGW